MSASFPTLRSVVLDTTDARELAEFYRKLLGYQYRAGDEEPEGQDWLVLVDPGGGARLAFQEVAELPAVTWPEGATPQQLHLDFSVATTNELALHHDRALALGARVLDDRSDDPGEPLYVFADPAGHPFCIFVS